MNIFFDERQKMFIFRFVSSSHGIWELIIFKKQQFYIQTLKTSRRLKCNIFYRFTAELSYLDLQLFVPFFSRLIYGFFLQTPFQFYCNFHSVHFLY